jgi:hypothetical protein
MPRQRKPAKTMIGDIAADEQADFDGRATALDLHQFVKELISEIQGHLWGRAGEISVSEFIKLVELERETRKLTETRRPKELRVVWINKKIEPSLINLTA